MRSPRDVRGRELRFLGRRRLEMRRVNSEGRLSKHIVFEEVM
jgi:hypothetical protein